MSKVHLRVQSVDCRGQGVTSYQIINAPIDSVYVWMNSNLIYPRMLANYLGRSDLIVKSCNEVFNNDTWHAAKQEIVIDHSVYDHCSSRVFDGISRYEQWKSSL